VDIDALVQESQAVRDEADRLLRGVCLVERLQPYGAVQVGGSYRWNTMLLSNRGGHRGSGDLDLYVVNAQVTLDHALEAFTGFLRRGDFLRGSFWDAVRSRPPGSPPEGYH